MIRSIEDLSLTIVPAFVQSYKCESVAVCLKDFFDTPNSRQNSPQSLSSIPCGPSV